MSDLLDDMKADAARDMNLAKVRITAITRIQQLKSEMEASGIPVDLGSSATTGVLSLQIGLGAVAQIAAPAPARSLPAPEPTPKTGGQRRPAAEVQPPADPRKKELKTGPYDDAEFAQLMRLHSQGLTVQDIATELGRDPRGVGVKLAVMKRNAPQQSKSAPAPAPTPAPAPKPAPTVSAPAAGLQLALDGLSAREKAVEYRLRAIGYPDPWTPRKDLQLVERLVQGGKLAGVAMNMGLKPEVARHRWNALLPEVTLDGQKALVRVLGLRAGVAGVPE